MKLGIFGASGATGRHLIEQALAAGHDVTAVVRTAGTLTSETPRLKIFVSGLDRPAELERVVKEQDAIISVLGARKGGPSTVCADGARNILKAMKATGVRRFIALSAYGASETKDASMFIKFVRTVIADKMRDKDTMESLIRRSGLDWTLVRPPALTNGKRTGDYRFGADLKIGPLGRISRADVADFILREAIATASIGKTFAVSV
ncbi:SDR family oxidoreductase [Caballeronia sp. dw_19]|uniref:NAD(P)-dependent oxidoreductase n=1 Tax=Caballeronia sp. dw_19 TaxID=2719791 RepID=UPI001BCDC59F|nr:SDR family oxidoreductase [Caballeronia sp. dw_19]